ncbi:MAG TPA: urate hydroxylase PuuD [Terriglobales bacterium]|nr:urate hydroxylase PuuD [Terriglobales bacterium]
MSGPSPVSLAALLAPGGPATTQIIFRWIHFVAGITWIGLLYFFNLVSNPALKQMDAGLRVKVVPALMSRALWWFRWSALVTVLAGIAYWMMIVGADARNAQASPGQAIWSFFLIWTVAFAIENGLVMPLKGPLNSGLVLGILVAIDVAAASYLYVHFNNHGWESNRLLCIGIGGGIGWMLLLNVWGLVWRIQKRIILWTRAFAEQGTAIPEKAQRMGRQAFLVSQISAWLTLPLLFFMGAASHFPILGK